jgi:DNA end-binding protein Ku
MRPLWTGSISFGLVSIPVKVYSAARERALSFRLLDKKDHCPISYKKVCRDDDKPVRQQDIVKGYEYEKGVYVPLEPEDFKKANSKKTGTIDILKFVDVRDIEAKYFEKPYYLEPDKKAAKAYSLLRDALGETKKVGIATFVMRDREHIVALKADEKIIELIQLRFNDEIVDPKNLDIPGKREYSKNEMEIAKSLIEKLVDKFDPKDYKDTYTEELMRLIEAKAKGKKIRVSDEKAPKPTDVTDLLAALKKSLEREKASSKK